MTGKRQPSARKVEMNFIARPALMIFRLHCKWLKDSLISWHSSKLHKVHYYLLAQHLDVEVISSCENMQSTFITSTKAALYFHRNGRCTRGCSADNKHRDASACVQRHCETLEASKFNILVCHPIRPSPAKNLGTSAVMERISSTCATSNWKI